jgi:hypothetical protein
MQETYNRLLEEPKLLVESLIMSEYTADLLQLFNEIPALRVTIFDFDEPVSDNEKRMTNSLSIMLRKLWILQAKEDCQGTMFLLLAESLSISNRGRGSQKFGDLTVTKALLQGLISLSFKRFP